MFSYSPGWLGDTCGARCSSDESRQIVSPEKPSSCHVLHRCPAVISSFSSLPGDPLHSTRRCHNRLTVTEVTYLAESLRCVPFTQRLAAAVLSSPSLSFHLLYSAPNFTASHWQQMTPKAPLSCFGDAFLIKDNAARERQRKTHSISGDYFIIKATSLSASARLLLWRSATGNVFHLHWRHTHIIFFRNFHGILSDISC